MDEVTEANVKALEEAIVASAMESLRSKKALSQREHVSKAQGVSPEAPRNRAERRAAAAKARRR